MTKEEITEKEEMILELQEIAEAFERTPTRDEFVEYSNTKWKWVKFWPYWNDFVSDAGLPNTVIRRGPDNPLTKEEMVSMFLELQKQIGKQPKVDEFRKICPHFKKNMQANFFGSYNDLVIEAGGTPRKIYNKRHLTRKPWTRDEILEMARQDIENDDIAPTGSAFVKKHHIGYQFLTTNFSSYEELMQLLMDEETMQEKIGRKRSSSVQPKKPSVKIIRQSWDKRYPVLYMATPAMLKWCRRRPMVKTGTEV